MGRAALIAGTILVIVLIAPVIYVSLHRWSKKPPRVSTEIDELVRRMQTALNDIRNPDTMAPLNDMDILSDKTKGKIDKLLRDYRRVYK